MCINLKSVPGFANYFATECGCVFNRNGKVLRPYLAGEKKYLYPYVRLYHKGEMKRRRVNRLIYESFHGSIPKGIDIHHIDDDKNNNSIQNLQALNRSANCFLRNRRDKSRWGRGILKRGKSFVVHVRYRNKTVFYKRFDSHKDALKARDEQLEKVTASF